MQLAAQTESSSTPSFTSMQKGRFNTPVSASQGQRIEANSFILKSLKFLAMTSNFALMLIWFRMNFCSHCGTILKFIPVIVDFFCLENATWHQLQWTAIWDTATKISTQFKMFCLQLHACQNTKVAYKSQPEWFCMLQGHKGWPYIPHYTCMWEQLLLCIFHIKQNSIVWLKSNWHHFGFLTESRVLVVLHIAKVPSQLYQLPDPLIVLKPFPKPLHIPNS